MKEKSFKKKRKKEIIYLVNLGHLADLGGQHHLSK
jgi:hypothetical protein